MIGHWTSDEFARIGSADELRIAALRRDGRLRKQVTIWVAPYEGDLYVRSVNGRDAGWFRDTQAEHQGRIWSGGIEKDVSLVEADRDIADELDAAYREKYRQYQPSIVNSIVSPAARSATLKLVPR